LKIYNILFLEFLFNTNIIGFSNLILSTLVAKENLANNTTYTYFFTYNISLLHFSLYLSKKVLANKTLKEQIFFIKRNKLIFKTKLVLNYIESLK